MLTQSYLLSKKIELKALYLAAVLSAVTIFVDATPAAAVQLIYSEPGNVSKIEDLVVDGINYDVTFKYDSFFNVFGSPNNPDFKTPTFWNNSQTAQIAVNSIASLMNSVQPTATKLNNYPSALVPYRGIGANNDSLFIVSKIDNYITRWENIRGESQDIFTKGSDIENYALFTAKEQPKSIPESNLGGVFVVSALIAGVVTANKKIRRLGGRKA
jgi:hypothetical protein